VIEEHVMNRLAWFVMLVAAMLFVAPRDLQAQVASPGPHIGYIYPSGGQRGRTFEVVVGGQYLKEATEAYISGGGVKVQPVKWYRPMTQGEAVGIGLKLRDVQEKLEEEYKRMGKPLPVPIEVLAKASGITEYELKEREIYQKRQADPKRQPNPQIEEELTVRVTIDADAPLGNRELRVITPAGMSNPMWFQVGQWSEVRETEPNNVKADPVIGSTLPVVVNGQAMPGDVDRFSFMAKKGMRLVLNASARELVPYLADAVPGWFQATLALYDPTGKEVGYAGAYRHRQDPVIYYEVPQDGEYVVEIHDSIYRGREDFVYRITIGEVPFVTGIYPMGGRAGTELDVELQGWNLLTSKMKINATIDRGRPLRWYVVPEGEKVSIRVPMAVDMMNEVMEKEPNDTLETAQAVTMPVIVNGRIDKPDDVDIYSFEGYGKFVADLSARRMGSPMDSQLAVLDANGKELAFNDDHEDKGLPLLTHHADSQIWTVLPGMAKYYLRVTDAQRKGGPDFIYRLQIRPPRPDFELRVTPSSVIARPGTAVPITIHALRKEEFTEDISLTLDKPPAGYKLTGAWIPGNADKVRCTLTVPLTTTPEPISLQMEGHSMGRGRKLTRVAVPAESMMQAFAYFHLVPTKDFTVMISGKANSKPALAFVQDGELRISLGGKTKLRAMALVKNPPPKELTVELSEPPDGISIDKVTPVGPGIEILLATDASKVKTGMKGNLIFKAFREYTPPTIEGRLPPKPQRTELGFLPAVTFEVVGKAPRPAAKTAAR
jgi:hypothetical protein